jgi:hypothetical protein
MPELLLGPVLLAGLLTVYAAVINTPLLLAARLTRRRLPPIASKLALAVGFSAATTYILWAMERFDVWRWGTPSIRYILQSYLPWIASLGLVGWFVGGLAVGRRQPGRS